MRMDWLPISAAALLTGAAALFFGAMMTPRPSGDGELLRRAATESENWVVVAALLTVAAVGLVVGLPSLFTLFQRRGSRAGLLAAMLLAVGCVMLAAFAQQLLFLRSLAQHDAVTGRTIEALGENHVQQVLVGAGFLIFYAGELALALALLRARTTPVWVPWSFVAHVALAAVALRVLPEDLQGLPALFMTAGFAGAGIAANRTARP
jgi:hypothetical protein